MAGLLDLIVWGATSDEGFAATGANTLPGAVRCRACRSWRSPAVAVLDRGTVQHLIIIDAQVRSGDDAGRSRPLIVKLFRALSPATIPMSSLQSASRRRGPGSSRTRSAR